MLVDGVSPIMGGQPSPKMPGLIFFFVPVQPW